MLRLLTGVSLLLTLTSCVVIHLPPERNTHTTDIQVELLQPFDWNLTVAPVTEVATHTSSRPGCELPPPPPSVPVPLLGTIPEDTSITPAKLEAMMLEYIDNLHVYILQYQENDNAYREQLQVRCGGDTQ